MLMNDEFGYIPQSALEPQWGPVEDPGMPRGNVFNPTYPNLVFGPPMSEMLRYQKPPDQNDPYWNDMLREYMRSNNDPWPTEF